MISRSMFIKFVSPNGMFYIEERRVWEPEIFLSALARFEGGDGYKAVVTTEAHYKEWKMESGNEPEIDAAIAEQEAINRMRWEAVLALIPVWIVSQGKVGALLNDAELVVEAFRSKHGVVK